MWDPFTLVSFHVNQALKEYWKTVYGWKFLKQSSTHGLLLWFVCEIIVNINICFPIFNRITKLFANFKPNEITYRRRYY